MKKSIILLVVLSIFTLISCESPTQDVSDDEADNTILVELPPETTYFLGLNNHLTKQQFSGFSKISSVVENDDGDTEITVEDNVLIKSTSLASGSRGGFAMGGFNPAIVFPNDPDPDSDTVDIEELTSLSFVKEATKRDGKIIITLDKDSGFEFRIAASGSRGGFAVGGYNPAIAPPPPESDDEMTQEEFEILKGVDDVFINTDGSTTILLGGTFLCNCVLTNTGSRGGFTVGGFSPAIVCGPEEDGNPFDSFDDLASQEAIRSIAMTDNNKVKIVIEDGFNYRFTASGSRGGFAVGGFSPAISFPNEPIDDDNSNQSQILFKDSPALKSYEVHDDGSSTLVIDKNYQDELINMFQEELTAFLDEMNNYELTMQYVISYEEDLSSIELIIPDEYLTRHDLHNDYYTPMYQTLEHYQYLYHVFNGTEISYQFVVKHGDKIFYKNVLIDRVKG